MSQQQSLEQERATAAWNAVKQVKVEGYEKKYKPLAAGSAADIQINGLGQTLAFWLAKGKDHHKALYQHLSKWLKDENIAPQNTDLLEWLITTASTGQYRRATAEASAYLLWLKRFAEGHLEGDERGDE